MVNYEKVDWEKEPRKAQYQLFHDRWGYLAYSLTRQVVVTPLVRYAKENGLKFSASLLYLLAKHLNGNRAFRFGFKKGEVVLYERVDPIFTLRNEDGTFSYRFVPFTSDFSAFYSAYLLERNRKENPGEIGLEAFHGNGVIITIIPDLSFESFAFHFPEEKDYYAPIIEVGRYEEKDGELRLALSFSVNHAVTNMEDLALFFKALEADLAAPEEALCKKAK